jgi:hypothetical protein
VSRQGADPVLDARSVILVAARRHVRSASHALAVNSARLCVATLQPRPSHRVLRSGFVSVGGIRPVRPVMPPATRTGW